MPGRRDGARLTGVAMPLRYSVVVPVRDEAETIGPFLRAIHTTLPPGYEVLLAYDDEGDSTLTALAALPLDEIPPTIRRIHNAGRPGPKEAIEAGMKAARAPVVVVMMADLSDDLPKVGRMVELVEQGAAVACASRYAPGGRQIGGPWLKGLLSRSAGHLLHWLSDLPTSDPTNSFKAYSRAFLERTPIESRAGFSLALELTVKAHLAGERVAEVPATWIDRRGGASKFKLLRWLPEYLFWFGWGLQALLLPQRPATDSAGGAAAARRPRGALTSRLRLAGALLLLALPFAAWLDLPREIAGDELDPSWRRALGQTFLHDLRLGDELVFTGGPLAFLATASFDRALYWPRLLWGIGWAVLATLLTARVLAGLPHLAWRVALVGLLLAGPPDRFLFPLLLAVLFTLRDDGPMRRGAFGCALLAGVIGALNLAGLWSAVALLLPVLARAGSRHGSRTAVAVAAAGIATFVAPWMLAGQPLDGLRPFFAGAAQLTSGYAGAMSLTSAQAEWRFGLLLVGLLLIAASRLGLAERRPGSAPLAFVALALVLGLAFRHAFVRQDVEHMAPFFSLTAALALALPALAPPAAERRRGAYGLLLAAAALSLVLLARVGPPIATKMSDRGDVLLDNVTGVVRPFRHLEHLLEREAAMRSAFRLPQLAAAIGRDPVDLFTVKQGVLFLNDLAWRPRPVFQSYAAFTPQLAELNRAFLAGPHAPDWLLVRWSSIDGRLPALEDGPALLELLARYRAVSEEKGYLLMRRTSPSTVGGPSPPRLGRVLWRGSFRLSETLSLSGFGDGPKALRLHLRPTLYGRLVGALLGARELAAELRTDDGATTVVRIVPSMAESAFLIDPAARRDRDLDRLLRGEPLPHPVSLRFLPTPRARASYRPEVDAELFALPALASPPNPGN